MNMPEKLSSQEFLQSLQVPDNSRRRKWLKWVMWATVAVVVLGGIIGIILGLTAGILLTHFFAVPFVLNTGIIVLSFSFSLITGMVFGYFPARRAAAMDPIQALRYE